MAQAPRPPIPSRLACLTASMCSTQAVKIVGKDKLDEINNICDAVCKNRNARQVAKYARCWRRVPTVLARRRVGLQPCSLTKLMKRKEQRAKDEAFRQEQLGLSKAADKADIHTRTLTKLEHKDVLVPGRRWVKSFNFKA